MHGGHDSSPRGKSEEKERYTNEELITELRIRIAVLENELKHAKSQRDEAVDSSVLITKTLISALDRGDKENQIRKTESELKELSLENVALREALGQPQDARLIDNGSSDNRASHNISDYNGIHSHVAHVPQNGRDSSSHKLLDPPKSYNPPLHHQHEPPTVNYPKPLYPISIISRALSSEQRVNYTDPWDQSIHSNSTVPNIPIVTDQTANGPPPNLQLSTQESASHTNMNAQVLDSKDVGFGSLDAAMEVLSDLGDAPINPNTNMPSESDIDAQMTGTASLAVMPPPTVLKAGFDAKRSFKGDEYNSEKARAQVVENQVQAPSYRPIYGHATREYKYAPGSAPTGPIDQVQWTAIWKSREERQAAIDLYRQSNDGRQLPDLFRYGNLYVPGEADSNYFRTVSIGNLPANIDLRDVLARVRGGEVMKAVLLDTMKLTGGMTCLVQFLKEASADDYLSYTAAHPISFGGDNKVASISLIETPTYPNYSTFHSMRELLQTRFIAINEFPKHISISKLERDIACNNKLRADSLIEIYLDDEGTLHLEFSSVQAAGSSYGILSGWHIYKHLEVYFERDSCTGPVEELELPVRPRHSMTPRIRYEPPMTPASTVPVQQPVVPAQRQPLAALVNQTVAIPTFSGKRIKSTNNWADEVNDEVDDDVVAVDAGEDDDDSDDDDDDQMLQQNPPTPFTARPFALGRHALDDVFGPGPGPFNPHAFRPPPFLPRRSSFTQARSARLGTIATQVNPSANAASAPANAAPAPVNVTPVPPNAPRRVARRYHSEEVMSTGTVLGKGREAREAREARAASMV